MRTLQRRLLRIAAAVALAVVGLALAELLVPGKAHGSLVGDAITGTGNQLFAIPPSFGTNSVIVRAGPEFTGIIGAVDFDFGDGVTGGTLSIFTNGVSWCCFGTYVFADLDFTEGDIIGLSLITSSGFVGPFLTDFSFTAHSISLNFNSGNTGSGAGGALYHITVVPLPAALPLFLSALAGLGFVGWRRRQAGA